MIQNKDDYILVIAGKKQSGEPIIEPNYTVGATEDLARNIISGTPAEIIYVDKVNGSDLTGDGTSGNPYKTWAFAKANAAGRIVIEWMGGHDLDRSNLNFPTQASQGTAPKLISETPWYTFSRMPVSLRSVAYNGNVYVASGQRYDNYGVFSDTIIFYSYDLISWYPARNQLLYAIPYPVLHITKIISIDGVFIGTDDLSPIRYLFRSPDGLNWTVQQQPTPTKNLYLRNCDVNPSSERIYAAGQSFGDDIKAIYSDDSGLTWTYDNNAGAGNLAGKQVDLVLYKQGRWFMLNRQGSPRPTIRYSTDDGATWNNATVTAAANPYIEWMESNGSVLLAIGYGTHIRSTDGGATWTQVATGSHDGALIFDGTYFRIIKQNLDEAISTDGLNWTTIGNGNEIDFVPTPRQQTVYDSDKDITVIGGLGGIIVKGSDNTQIALTAELCGFQVEADFIFQNDKITNCTMKAESFYALFNLVTGKPLYFFLSIIDVKNAYAFIDQSRFVDLYMILSIFILRNSAFPLLITGGTYTVGGTVVNTDRCTVVGDLHYYNLSTDGFETIIDTVITRNIISAYDSINMESGCVAGQAYYVNLAAGVFRITPIFRDSELYILMDALAGDPYTSVLLEKSELYTMPSGQKRDLGAWSFDRAGVSTYYERPHWLTRPRDEDRFRHVIEPLDFTYDVGDDGEPDAYNNPERTIERIKITLKSVSIDDLYFLEYLYSLKNTEALVSFDVKNEVKIPSVVVNGNQSAGTPVIDIISMIHVSPGAKLTIGSQVYVVMYPIPRTGYSQKLVLSKVTESDLTNGQELNLNFPKGMGIYKIILTANDYFYPIRRKNKIINTIVIEFVRKMQ